MTTKLTELVLKRRGCPLHAWVGGPEGGPLVVLTHGACVDHHSFDSTVPALTGSYRVMIWDVRGHGQSQPMGDDYTSSLAVEDLLALVDRLGYDRAVFLGHSNGSYIGQELAFRHPHRVQALVIANGTCITWSRGPLALFFLKHSAMLMAVLPFEMLKKSGLKMFSYKKEGQDYIYRAFSQISKKDFVKIWDGAVKGLHPEPNYRISQPLLLMHGDDDRTGDMRKIMPLWAKLEPNCEYIVIPHARHLAMFDNPDSFNRVLMEFLEKWASTRS
jgi:pimeloyl-ACP methyl ester carboxylesterase